MDSFLGSTLSRAISTPVKLYHYLRPPSSASESLPPSSPAPAPNHAAQTTSRSSFGAPSPLTYLTSSYLLLSLSLAFLLHRIHHLVPPSHRPSPHGTPANDRGQQRVNTRIVQLGIRLPGILYMLKTSAALYLARDPTTTLETRSRLVQLALRGLQASTRFCGKGQLGNYIEPPKANAFDLVAGWMNHSSLLWQTFLSISTSITLETFVRALSDDTPSLHSFNLLSFSFLLHVQSHPSSIGNEQLYLYLLLTLLELVSLQSSYLVPYLVPTRSHTRENESDPDDPTMTTTRTRTRSTSSTPTTTKRYRFVITLFFSFVSQYLAIRSYHLFYHQLVSPSSPNEGAASNQTAAATTTSDGALIWFNKLPEIGFELIVLSSIALKFFAALIRGEALDQENLMGAPVWWDWEEDYAVVLIKYATALLKATRLSQLSFELSPLEVLPSTVASSLESIGFDLSSTNRDGTVGVSDADQTGGDGEVDGGLRVRLERNGDVLLIEELVHEDVARRGGEGGTGASPSGLRRRVNRNRTEALEYGFGVEVKTVEIEPLRSGRFGEELEGAAAEWDGDWGSGFDRDGVEFVAIVLRIVFFVVYVAIKSGVTGLRTAMRFVGLRSLEGRLSDTWTTRQRPEPTIAHGDDFHRGFVLDGADDDDAEDEDWDPNSHEQDSEGGSDDEDEDERDFDEDENALALISDLSTSLEEEHRLTPTELAPYLVAHQLSASRSLLTRRQYNAIFPAANVDGAASSPSSSIDQLESAITGSLRSNDRLLKMTREERESKRQEWRESRSQFCVVCTVEPRTVILWPCRCLALCESCRDALALRTTASAPGSGDSVGNPGAGTGGNLCPTCRAPVAGYSKIFIP
ncbi:hypothetical protein JCM3766R1_001836 [Sporobolomyces carnicolor]